MRRMRGYSVNKRWMYAGFISIILCNIVRLFSSTLWADECFTYALVKKSWGNMIIGTMKDFHPPLYYMITKCFCIVSNYSIVGYRLSSLTAVFLLAALGYRKMKEMAGKQEGTIFACLVLLAPTMYYSVEMRMYSWAYLFVTMFTIYIFQFLHEQKRENIFWCILYGIFAAYTHYFTLIMIALIYAAVLVLVIIRKQWEKMKVVFFSIIISILLYLPWIGIVMTQITAYGKSEIEVKALSYYLKVVVGSICLFTGTLRTVTDLPIGESILTIVSTIGILYFLIRYFVYNVKKKAKWLDLFYILIFATIGCYLAGIVMDVISHTFVARYMYPLTGMIWILLSLAITGLKKERRKLVRGMAILLGAIFLIDCGITIEKEYKEDELNKQSMEYVRNNIGKDDIIITDYRIYAWNVLRYYFPDIWNELYMEPRFEVYRQYNHVWYIHAKQVDNEEIMQQHKWTKKLESSLAENDFELYILSEEK